MARLIVFDFDGTLTDAEEEGRPFRGGYLEDVAVLCGISTGEVHVLAERFEALVAADPQGFGWMYDGHIVAPATVDPYLRMMPVARMIFEHLGRFQDSGDRDRLLDGILYKYNYPKTLTAFRAGARELLLRVPAEATYIVTNSHTEPVQDKVRQLSGQGEHPDALLWLVDRVHGRAKKYILDETLTAVPATVTVPGLGRPILPRRRLYFEVLDALRTEVGADWDQVCVVGDIFELDLVTPLTLGASVALVVNQHTPQYEQDYLQAHPRGAVLGTLEAVGDWLLG